MTNGSQIKHNRIQCLACDDVIESKYTHDFRWCECGAVAVDGGRHYLKRSGVNYEEQSVWYSSDELACLEIDGLLPYLSKIVVRTSKGRSEDRKTATRMLREARDQIKLARTYLAHESESYAWRLKHDPEYRAKRNARRKERYREQKAAKAKRTHRSS